MVSGPFLLKGFRRMQDAPYRQLGKIRSIRLGRLQLAEGRPCLLICTTVHLRLLRAVVIYHVLF